MIVSSRSLLPESMQSREFIYGYHKEPVKYSKNNVVTGMTGFAFRKYDIFYDTFRMQLQRLFEAGIISNLYKRVFSLSGSRDVVLYEPKKKKEILSLKHLYPGFYIWIGSILVSCLAFVGEIITFRIQIFFNAVQSNIVRIILKDFNFF